MIENPYEPPTIQPEKTEPSADTPFRPRKRALAAMAIGWNVPMFCFFFLEFSGKITERTFNFLLGGWMAAIPLFVLLFEYSPKIQNWLFTGTIEPSRRLAALILAAIWGVASGIWIYLTLRNG